MSNSQEHSDSQILVPPQESESPLSSLIYTISQRVQMTMENMLKMITEIDEVSAGVKEDLEKNKEKILEKKRVLEDEKGKFQRAAKAALEILNSEISCASDERKEL